jgi:hypothetical protein
MGEQDDALPLSELPTELVGAPSTDHLEAPSDQLATPLDVAGRGKGVMAPSTMVRGSADCEISNEGSTPAIAICGRRSFPSGKDRRRG